MTEKKTKASTLERIKSARVKGRKFRVAEWDVDVELRSMTIAQKDYVGEVSEDSEKFIPAVLVATCFDPETGEALFSDEDSDWFTGQPASAIEPLLLEALKASGLSEDQLAGAVEQGKGDS